MRVLFWGTSAFAVPSLRALAGEGFDVAGVVTQPDRPSGRSRSVLVPPPVKAAALEMGVPIFQPEKPRGAEFFASLRALAPDLSVVASYGHILTQEAIDLAPKGTLNVHASLLPRFRGAAPIQAAIREGVLETGVTIMRMVRELDAGPIVLQGRTPVERDETAGELELRLSELGALALVEALTLLELGQASEREQDHAAATYAPKIEREMARVNWQEGCGVVARVIRAYDPKPGAFTTLRAEEVKLFGAAETDEAGDEGRTPFGTVLAIDDAGMLVACGDGAVRVAQAQPAGRKRLAAAEWQRGRGIAVGDRLGA
ncbi:MAG TPA: methionyl-tRNA formyltransferase [Gemmatimonadaceae bacterium]|nr:methionyl-tRNA formyltransferase [Gemmatimonadaceae bacterium]